MYCDRCGAQNVEDAKFCQTCGNQLDYVIKNEKKSNKKNNKVIYCIIGLVIILVAVIIAITFALRGKSGKEYEQYMESAAKYVEEFNYEEAKDYYLQAISIAPKELEPYVRLAKIHMDLDEIPEAEEILAKAEENSAEGSEEVEDQLEEIERQIEEIKGEEADEQIEDYPELPEGRQKDLIDDTETLLSQEEKIEHIRDVYYSTQDKLDEYKQDKIEGVYTRYLDSQGIIKKIVVYPSQYEFPEAENAQDYVVEYFYDVQDGGIRGDENFIFAFVYNKHTGEEYRFYVHDGELIRYIDEDGDIKESGNLEMGFASDHVPYLLYSRGQMEIVWAYGG